MFAGEVADRPLMDRIDVAVQEADGQRPCAPRDQRRERLDHFSHFKGRDDVPAGLHSLGDLQNGRPGHQWRREIDVVVERVAPRLAPDLEYIAEPARGQDRSRRGFSGQQGICGHGGPVAQEGDVRSPGTVAFESGAQARQHGLGTGGGGGGRLVYQDLPVLRVVQHDVGERAPDVDTDPVSLCARSLRPRRHLRAHPVPRTATRDRALASSHCIGLWSLRTHT